MSAVICGYARSAFQPANRGAFVGMRADDIAVEVIRGLIQRTNLVEADIEDIKMGCAFPEGEQGFNVARMVAMQLGLPKSVAGVTTNRFCGSSMNTIHDAAGAIAMGAGELFVCAGLENMSRMPMTGLNPAPNATLYAMNPDAYESMGITAENVANKYGLSRKKQDEFAALSHSKAYDAQKNGRLRDEIVEVSGVVEDGCIRPETTVDSLAALKPVFDQTGSVTAGTSSPLTDGVSAVIVASEAYADKHGLPKLARIKSAAISGCSAALMGLGPIAASNKALERAGLTMDDMDVIELNEAFAAQALAVIKDLKIDTKKLNLDGGAIALGHPLGASGARITGKAAQLLQRENGRYALATMCIGGGQGIATVLEAI